jgi:hypothetical protein
MPPLPASQVAAVARIAARLDASRRRELAEPASQPDNATTTPGPVR